MKNLSLGAAWLILAGGVAFGQLPTPSQVQNIGPADLFQDIQNGVPQPARQYANALLLGNYAATQPGNNDENDVVGGDFGQNLFQDGTSVGTITTTATYVADQFFAFSGTSTTIGGAQETGAADIPPGYTASLRITRTGSGVIQACVGTIIPSANVTRYQGQTLEVDAHALAGAGFSAASSNLTFVQVQGTGTNDSAANFAKTVNGALSGTAWAGAVVNSVNVPISTSFGRYSVAFPVASTTTEMGAAWCWTPVGASPSNDYFEFTGAQMTPNSALATVAGTTGGALSPNDRRAKSFLRRPIAVETALELSFYWRQNEPASGAGVAGVYGTCQGTSTNTVANCFMQFPVAMFKVPTLSYTAGTIAMTATSTAAAEAVSGLVIPTNGATLYGASLTATSSSVAEGGFGYLESGNSTGGGKIAFSARF